ncbi:MAG: T9SS type A sorting domain-containing protein [Sphingobacteriales bacterium]|nr:MAG: T9SS type A sorting domain-containing protein [Sphingobacteriales bacterium]
MTATGICASPVVVTTDTFEMVVLPIITKPSVKITAASGFGVRPSDTVRFTASVSNGGTTPKYQWYKNGAILPGAQYATLTLFGLSYRDMIHVNIISEDPCAQNKNASDTVWMQFPLSVGESHNEALMLSPNPNSGAFTIKNISSGEALVTIYDAVGRLIFQKRAQVVDGMIQLAIDLVAGSYILKLEENDKPRMLHFSVTK